MSAADPEPNVPPESVRTLSSSPMVGSRRCPVCQEADLTGRQTVCSARCRRERTRQRESAARQARDQEIRALLETALRKLQEGP
jgi:predicted nucleic acid-binding Zn ribbon protein